MKVIKLGTKIEEPVSIALGFFDSIHIGHRKIIKLVTAYAKNNKTASAVFTFVNNPSDELMADKLLVYPYSARVKIFSRLHIDYLITAEFNAAFRNMPAEEFLSSLCLNDVRMISCGNDYRFGLNGSGNIHTLGAFAAQNGIFLDVVGDVKLFKTKVSSTAVRKHIAGGFVKNANSLLGAPYRIYGLNLLENINETMLRADTCGNCVKLPDGKYKTYFWCNSTKINTVAELKNYGDYLLVNLLIDKENIRGRELEVLFFTDRL